MRETMNGHEHRGAKGAMFAGWHCANMLAANDHAYLASADLLGSSRWYRICCNRQEGS
jgi:hypothetical protein